MTTMPRAVRCPLLVGRDDLLVLADRRLDDVTAGRGQFLLLAGEAGIGKTRLLAAIRRKAEARGFSAVEGAVAPQDRDVPAASILDLARSMTRLAPFADLGRELLDLCDATMAAEHVQRRRLVMGLVERILISLPGPTMLSFEDLQWADDVSLEIIAELARQSRDRPLLLTGDYRTEDVAPGASLRDWRARLITQRIAEEVRLAPLTEAETALVTTLILDTGLPAPRDVAAAVFERTDGIPLHIEELLGALSAEARADGTAIREATVPDTIEDAVIARMAHRSPEAQAAARAGAVIGRCFVPEVLAGIMDVPPEALEAPLQELVDHFVLDPPGLRGLYDFRHQLLRDALYRTIPTSSAADSTLGPGSSGPELEGASEIHASVHYERAGLRREAYEAAVAGAREAARLSAHREAFELYRRAVDNLPDGLRRSELGAILEAYAAEAAAIVRKLAAERGSRDARAAYLAADRRSRPPRCWSGPRDRIAAGPHRTERAVKIAAIYDEIARASRRPAAGDAVRAALNEADTDPVEDRPARGWPRDDRGLLRIRPRPEISRRSSPSDDQGTRSSMVNAAAGSRKSLDLDSGRPTKRAAAPRHDGVTAFRDAAIECGGGPRLHARGPRPGRRASAIPTRSSGRIAPTSWEGCLRSWRGPTRDWDDAVAIGPAVAGQQRRAVRAPALARWAAPTRRSGAATSGGADDTSLARAPAVALSNTATRADSRRALGPGRGVPPRLDDRPPGWRSTSGSPPRRSSSPAAPAARPVRAVRR